MNTKKMPLWQKIMTSVISTAVILAGVAAVTQTKLARADVTCTATFENIGDSIKVTISNLGSDVTKVAFPTWQNANQSDLNWNDVPRGSESTIVRTFKRTDFPLSGNIMIDTWAFTANYPNSTDKTDRAHCGGKTYSTTSGYVGAIGTTRANGWAVDYKAPISFTSAAEADGHKALVRAKIVGPNYSHILNGLRANLTDDILLGDPAQIANYNTWRADWPTEADKAGTYTVRAWACPKDKENAAGNDCQAGYWTELELSNKQFTNECNKGAGLCDQSTGNLKICKLDVWTASTDENNLLRRQAYKWIENTTNSNCAGLGCAIDRCNQLGTCTGAKPANTVWNDGDRTDGKFLQTWNGTTLTWTPASKTTTYNTTVGDCNFTCSVGYNWNGTSCARAVTCEHLCNELHEITTIPANASGIKTACNDTSKQAACDKEITTSWRCNTGYQRNDNNTGCVIIPTCTALCSSLTSVTVPANATGIDTPCISNPSGAGTGTGNCDGHVTTDWQCNTGYQPNANHTGCVPTTQTCQTLRGDVTCNGIVDISDLAKLSNYIRGETQTPSDLGITTNGDVNYNGVIENTDRFRLAQFLSTGEWALLNGGMEWNYAWKTEANNLYASKALDTSRFHTDTHSLKVTNTSANSGSAQVYQPVTLVAGRTYRLSGWVYVPSDNNGVKDSGFAMDPTAQSNPGILYNTQVENSWVQISHDYQITTTGVYYFKLRADRGLGDVAYWDDVQLTRIN